MYGEPANLDRLARALDERAHQVRRSAQDLLATAEATHWRSTAGDTMRGRARSTATTFEEVAGRYSRAAEAVREHARAVRRTLELIERIERRFHRLVDAARDRIAGAAQAAAETARDVAGSAREGAEEVGSWIGFGDGADRTGPDPGDVALCRMPQPPPGHRDWLDLASVAGVS